nr:hypothetical protein [Tanacetum cinerariifolium]
MRGGWLIEGERRRSGVTTSSRAIILSSLSLLLSGKRIHDMIIQDIRLIDQLRTLAHDEFKQKGEGGLIWYGPSLGTPYANSSSDHWSVKTQASSQARAEGNGNGNNGNQIRCYNFRGLAEEFDLMADATNLDEIEEVNANCILMANLQKASTSGTQSDKALVYDSDGSAEVQLYDNCYDDEIFNMFSQEEQYTELLEPILEPHQVQHNDSKVIFVVSSMEQCGRTVEQHLEIKRLLRVVVSQAIMSIVQNNSVVDTLNLQIELDRTKEHFENCIIKKENEYAKLLNDWVDNVVLNKPVKASTRTKPIAVSQPHVITKNEVNSKTNGFSPKDVKSTTRTRRPQPRNNPKNDKVPSKSKSSRLSNNLGKIEENHSNLQSSLNLKHMSSERNNIGLLFGMLNLKLFVLCNGVIVVSGIANQNGNGKVVAAQAEGNANENNGNQIRCYNCRGLGHLARNCTVKPRKRDATYLWTQLLIAQKEEA